jgi:anti-sigma regulatory factor (Ser/Thr protein kinase)
VSGGEHEHFAIQSAIDLQLAVLRTQRSRLLRGASDLDRSVVATIVSELASNVLKYGVMGSVELRRIGFGRLSEIEITALDAGPGIDDVALALTERYSSGATLGLGLPGVKRMADALEIGSSQSGGTMVRVRKRLTIPAEASAPDASLRSSERGPGWEAAAYARPRDGHRALGDHALIVAEGGHLLLAMIDATGHGLAAQRIARDVGERLSAAFARASDRSDVAGLLRSVHDAAAGTLGAAAGVAVIALDERELRYLAIGNVRCAIVGAQAFTGVSRDGVLGRRWPTPFVQRTPLHAGDLFLLWTDGLPEGLPRALAPLDPTWSAADVSRHAVASHARAHDDAACAALRWDP